MRFYVIFVLVISFMKINAQDSIPYSIDLRLYEGVYFSYQDFRFNWPIPKEKIISKINKDQLDFYTKLIEEEFIEFTERDGSVSKIKSEQVWGYCQNNVIFINQNKNFYRIPVFGSISNFIGTQEVINYSMLDAGTGLLITIPSSALNTTVKNYGDNRYEMNLNGILTASGKYYILEVKNEKNTSYYLKFKY